MSREQQQFERVGTAEVTASALANSFQINPQGLVPSSSRQLSNQSQLSSSNIERSESQNTLSGNASVNRNRRGRHTNSIAFAGQIVTGTNRQITIPSVPRNRDSSGDRELASRFKEREEEVEKFFFGSPKKKANRQHQNLVEQINTSMFNAESPDQKQIKVFAEDFSQLELLTQDSTPDKDHVDMSQINSGGQVHSLFSQIKEEGPGQIEALNQSNTASFRQIQSESRVTLNNVQEMSGIYKSKSKDSFDEGQQPIDHYFFNCDDESINEFAQESSQFNVQSEPYEMIQNKGLGKRNSTGGSKINPKSQHKRSRQQFQISDEHCSNEMMLGDDEDSANELDQLFSNQVLLTRQTMSEDHCPARTMKSKPRPSPAEPCFSLHDFKQSDTFRSLRDIQCYFDDLDFKEVAQESDENEGQEEAPTKLKFDFESQKGQKLCVDILKQIEALFRQYKVKKNDRGYRLKFTKAYQNLYEQNGGHEELCFLLEILDSAQENFPHLWVNGEKYVFSEDVINAGEALYRQFLDLRSTVNLIMETTMEQTCTTDLAFPHGQKILSLQKQLGEQLASFDLAWVTYEQYYVYELMVIETDSRRFIIDAIVIDEQMHQIETDLQQMGCNPLLNEEYNEKRQMLLQKLSSLNAVCNVNGKGRDDLVDIAILQAAEEIPNQLLIGEAQSIQILADKIRQSFNCFRILLQKYAENIDSLDPQLRNNKELLELVEIYENAWSQGQSQLLDPSHRQQIIKFCLNIEGLSGRYGNFKEQVECSEAEIFLSIPSLMILKSLQNDKDSHVHKQLCQRFCPSLDFEELQNDFNQIQGDKLRICANLEQYIINDDEKYISDASQNKESCSNVKFKELLTFGQKLKSCGMELSRDNAQEFNQFITAALGE